MFPILARHTWLAIALCSLVSKATMTLQLLLEHAAMPKGELEG